MNPTPERHGAVVPAEEMLRSINSLAVAVAENNVQLHSLIREMQDVKRDITGQKVEIDALKTKLYTMSGIIGIAVTVATNWITGQINS